MMDGFRNGFVNFRYDESLKRLLFEYDNTFIRRAIGFQFGTVFVGILIAHKEPPVVVKVTPEPPEAA